MGTWTILVYARLPPRNNRFVSLGLIATAHHACRSMQAPRWGRWTDRLLVKHPDLDAPDQSEGIGVDHYLRASDIALSVASLSLAQSKIYLLATN